MASEGLSEREIRVLEAVIQTYVETAEPAGSQTVAQRFALGVSSATIRNTMGELEEKGYLYHPHTSAGRIPTDRAYRWYVDNHMRLSVPEPEHRRMLEAELSPSRAAIEEIIRSAAQMFQKLQSNYQNWNSQMLDPNFYGLGQDKEYNKKHPNRFNKQNKN